MKILAYFILSSWCLLSSSEVPSIESNDLYAQFKEVFVESDGAQLFCRTIGQGDPVIVIHGGPGLSQNYLLPGMAPLGKNNFVIFYDQRGCGRSTGKIDEKSISLKTFLNDLEAIRQAFGYKKITALGHSWGGFLAMEYAISYPRSIDKLILLDTAPASSEDFRLFLDEADRRLAPYQTELNDIRKSQTFVEGDPNIVNKYYQILFRTYLYDPTKITLLNFHMSKQANIRGEKVSNILDRNILSKPYNLYGQLKKLHMPTLIIHGDDDIVPPITAQKIHESIPNSQYVLLKHCGHFPYVEDPDELFNYLKSFLHPNKKN